MHFVATPTLLTVFFHECRLIVLLWWCPLTLISAESSSIISASIVSTGITITSAHLLYHAVSRNPCPSPILQSHHSYAESITLLFFTTHSAAYRLACFLTTTYSCLSNHSTSHWIYGSFLASCRLSCSPKPVPKRKAYLNCVENSLPPSPCAC